MGGAEGWSRGEEGVEGQVEQRGGRGRWVEQKGGGGGAAPPPVVRVEVQTSRLLLLRFVCFFLDAVKGVAWSGPAS